MDHLDPELLSAYVDDELSAAERAQVERHLASCEPCRREHAELQAMASLVRGLPRYAPPRPVTVDTSRSGATAMSRIIEFATPIALAAAVLLIAFAGLRLVIDDDAGDDEDQISFSAVQPTPGGTEPGAPASDTTGGEAPAAMQESEGEDAAEAPAPAMAVQRTVAAPPPDPTPTIAPTVAPTADGDPDSWVTLAAVIAVVALTGAAAAWYMLTRSPRGRSG